MTIEELAEVLDAVSDAADTYRWGARGDLTTDEGVAATFLTEDELTCLQEGYVAGMCDAERMLLAVAAGEEPDGDPEEMARAGLALMGYLLAENRLRNVEEAG